MKLESAEDWNREALKDICVLNDYILEKWRQHIDIFTEKMDDAIQKDELIDAIVYLIRAYQLNKDAAKRGSNHLKKLRGGVRKEREYLSSVDKHIKALRKLSEAGIAAKEIHIQLDALSNLMHASVTPIMISISSKSEIESLLRSTLTDYEVIHDNDAIKAFIKSL